MIVGGKKCFLCVSSGDSRRKEVFAVCNCLDISEKDLVCMQAYFNFNSLKFKTIISLVVKAEG